MEVAFSYRCAILLIVNKESIFGAPRRWLAGLGLGDLWDELLRPGSPLAFLTAQGLRVAQPVLGAFTDAAGLAALAAWADQLEGPDTHTEGES